MAHTRRGTRIPVHISVTITSLDVTNWFSGPGLVILANQHGCAVRIRRRVSLGMPVILENLPGRNKTAAARVVNCISLGEYENFWLLGLELNEPGNIWGIETPPNDWLISDEPQPQPAAPSTLVDRVVNLWQSLSAKKGADEQVVH